MLVDKYNTPQARRGGFGNSPTREKSSGWLVLLVFVVLSSKTSVSVKLKLGGFETGEIFSSKSERMVDLKGLMKVFDYRIKV